MMKKSQEEEEGGSKDTTTTAAATTTTTTVYLMINHQSDVDVVYSNSLYAIDIPNGPPYPLPPRLASITVYDYDKAQDITIDTSAPRDLPLSPILTFHAAKYPHGMRCAKFFSKFYFLGGQFLRSDGKKGALQGIFPPQVHVYDPILRSLQPGVPMATGKPNPLVFVVDSKLYVLGSLACQDTKYFTQREIPSSRVSELDSGIKHFEAFDINTARWTVLKDPPEPISRNWWIRCALVSRKLVILGTPLQPPHYTLSHSSLQVVLFNLETQEWTNLSLPPPRPVPPVLHFTSSIELIGGDTFYGLAGIGANRKNMFAKLGPFTEHELDQFEFNKLFTHIKVNEVSFVDGHDADQVFGRFRGVHPSFGMCHLGRRLFCHVRTSCFTSIDYGDFVEYEGTNFIEIKLLQQENVDDKKDSFEAKYVYRANYIVKTSYNNIGTISACYALSHEEKKKLKKKMNSNVRRQRKNGNAVRPPPPLSLVLFGHEEALKNHSNLAEESTGNSQAIA